MAPMQLNQLTDMLARKVEQDLADTGNEDFCFALVVFTTDRSTVGLLYVHSYTRGRRQCVCADGGRLPEIPGDAGRSEQGGSLSTRKADKAMALALATEKVNRESLDFYDRDLLFSGKKEDDTFLDRPRKERRAEARRLATEAYRKARAADSDSKP